MVNQKLKELEEHDTIRNFRPPINGDDIIKFFGIKPCREIGIIKNAIKDAILDGVISNNYDEAYKFMIEAARGLGLEVKNKHNIDY